MKPDVSVYMMANRPFLWEDLCESLTKNQVTFEVIFVGDIPPSYVLPSNAHHIYSPVKPAQCAEIGRRACQGEFCFFGSDDMIFNDNCFDILLDKYHSMGREDVAVGCMHRCGVHKGEAGGRIIPISERGFIPSRPDSPLHPIGCIYKTQLYKDLGPLDKNFICTYTDFDMVMRLYERGGTAVLAENSMFTEIIVPGADVTQFDSGLNWVGKDCDFPLAVSLWMSGSTFLTKRARPVEPFVEEGLLTESQGPKGKWV